MEWIIGIIALAIGSLIGFLFADRKGAVARQRAQDLSNQLDAAVSESTRHRDQLMKAGNEQSSLQARLEASEKNLVDQRTMLEDAQAKLKDAFAELSRAALENNAKSFLQLAEQNFKTLGKDAEGQLETRKKEIETLLSPVRQTLNQYREELGKLELNRDVAYKEMLVQLTAVSTTQKDLGLQTRQLVDALRRPQTRGRWGELTLRRLFEMAGMANHCSFLEQVSVETADGRMRPDCIVKLPGDREVIIDSKVVIDAFLDSAAAPDEACKTECLTRHARQVRNRMEELAKKTYWQQFAQSADYVVMFLPGEAFLYAAVEIDPGLIEDGLANHIIIASPSTLLGLLRVIEMGWKQKAVEENANTIRDLATELYDRVRVMAEHFEGTGEALAKAVESYNKTLVSLERNVVTQARRMAELGVAAKKEMPELPEIAIVPRELSAHTWKSLT